MWNNEYLDAESENKHIRFGFGGISGNNTSWNKMKFSFLSFKRHLEINSPGLLEHSTESGSQSPFILSFSYFKLIL